MTHELGGGLPDQIAHDRADHAKGDGFGHKQAADVRWGQPHRVESADLPGALIYRTHHGVEHDQGGDAERHHQRPQTGNRRHPHRIDQKALAIQTDEEVEIQRFCQLFQPRSRPFTVCQQHAH